MLRSFLFRIILLMFSYWIVDHNENIFPKWEYYVFMVIYYTIYCFLKHKQKDILRLAWDFVLINVVIWGKELHDPMTFMLVIVPMINAINYTGKRSHLYLLSLLTLGTLMLHLRPFESWIVIPIVALAIMYLTSVRTNRLWRTEKEITENVNGYFLDPLMLKPHKIYKNIITELNNYFHFKEGQGIKLITTYALKGETLWLVSASDFLWTRTRHLENQQLQCLKKDKELRISDDNINTYLFYIPIGEVEYVFTCDISNASYVTLNFYKFKDMMRLTFSKMSILLSTEYRISERREEKFNEIKDNVLYVNQAVKVMHFIRNKMTPLSNLIAYHKEIGNMSDDILDKMKDRISKEANQAETDLSEILKFANYLLDKSKNPFLCTEIQEVSISKIYLIISEIAERAMQLPVTIDENIKLSADKGLCIHTNLVESKIMFTDWITNMMKYSTGSENISMYIEEDKLTVHFENQCRIKDKDIGKLVRDMNSNAKDAVLEGKEYGYGIYIIKSIARELGVEISAKKQNKQDQAFMCLDFKYMIYGRN
mgnify:FL=1